MNVFHDSERCFNWWSLQKAAKPFKTYFIQYYDSSHHWYMYMYTLPLYLELQDLYNLVPLFQKWESVI